MEVSINQEQLKSLIKTALVEVLEERQDLLCEAIEDVALAHAIEEGKGTELVQREEVFKLFEGAT
ncbi:MAG: hypothetical protein V1753_08145 [Pseudomonadota bacterium]